jgi:hypothetical protein
MPIMHTSTAACAAVTPLLLLQPVLLLLLLLPLPQPGTDTLLLHGGRLEPHEPCSLQTLRALGVLSWKLDADKYENDPQLEAIRKVRNYSYTVRHCR